MFSRVQPQILFYINVIIIIIIVINIIIIKIVTMMIIIVTPIINIINITIILFLIIPPQSKQANTEDNINSLKLLNSLTIEFELEMIPPVGRVTVVDVEVAAVAVEVELGTGFEVEVIDLVLEGRPLSYVAKACLEVLRGEIEML